MDQRRLMLIPLLAVALAAHAQDRTADPLGPLTQCVNSDGFHYERKDRLPATVSSRRLDMAAGPAQVSTADGYRLMVYRKSSSPLINLKIELSAEGKFAADREAIIAQMKEIAAATKPPHAMNLETGTRHGVELLALHNESIDHAPGVISMYTLMNAEKGVVATAYVLNQRPEVREYATDAEYATLRDHFIALLSECMANR
jgi:hypothetical protein